MKNITEDNNENKDSKPATETPLMTEEELKKFISIISNSETIQGDYIFNGFLFFFQSVSETIKTDPIGAQNLMFHLQQHVFNNLMWESFWALDAHRKKAHLIFRNSEPFIYEAEAEEPTAAENTDKTSFARETVQPIAATLADHHLQITANKISHILRSDKVLDETKEAFFSILLDAANEANVGVTSPELVKLSFPLIIKSLEFEYGKGVVHSLASLLESSLGSPVEDELIQYEKRFDSSEVK